MPKKELKMDESRKKDLIIEYGEAYTPDKKDMEILRHLSADGRMNLLQLAKKVKLSREGVRYRVQKLIDKRVILGFAPIINPPCFGYSYICEVMFALHQLDVDTEKEMISSLKSTPEIVSLASIQGKWDVSFTVVAKDSHHFNSILKGIRNRFSAVIKDFEISTILEEHKYEDYTGLFR